MAEKKCPELLEANLGPKFGPGTDFFFFKIDFFSKKIFFRFFSIFFDLSWKMQKKIFTPLWGQVTRDLEFFQNKSEIEIFRLSLISLSLSQNEIFVHFLEFASFQMAEENMC